MKLLFDHNLPLLLVSCLADIFPNSQHVFAVNLDRARDWDIREYARLNGFLVVTKDADFSELCVLRGFPPKIIWIRRGNCSVRDLEDILRQHHEDIENLETDDVNGVLTLF